MAFNSQRHLDV